MASQEGLVSQAFPKPVLEELVAFVEKWCYWVPVDWARHSYVGAGNITSENIKQSRHIGKVSSYYDKTAAKYKARNRTRVVKA
mmetsp:Transcript_3489/g.7456  ORF Transcript_3489/g.7456 Transcript_3489/m.7456 type:complete len:83 (+) Transcript_3489:771-1019(+)